MRYTNITDECRERLRDYASDICTELLGSPTVKRHNQLRWGSKGSIRLNVGNGYVHDFETGDSLDMVQLAQRELL